MNYILFNCIRKKSTKVKKNVRAKAKILEPFATHAKKSISNNLSKTWSLKAFIFHAEFVAYVNAYFHVLTVISLL